MCLNITNVFFFKQKTAYEISACLVGSEMCIRAGLPGYLDEESWQSLTEAGFNRFSLGVQDFNEKVLKTVNRHP